MNISLPQFFRHTSIFFWVKSRQIYYSFINIYLFLLSLRLVDHSKSLTRLQSNTVFTGRNSLFHLKGLCSCAVHGPRMFETVCAWNLDWIGFKYLKKRGVHELCFFFFNYCLLLILILADGAISQAQPSTCTCSDIWNNFQVMSSHTLVHPSIPFFCSPLLLPPPHPTHSAYPFLSIPTPPSLPYLCSIPPLPPNPALLNSVDGKRRTLTDFSLATRQCWPLQMRKWFRIWTKTSSRDSLLSTRSFQEVLPPLPLPSRLDIRDTDTHNDFGL